MNIENRGGFLGRNLKWIAILIVEPFCSAVMAQPNDWEDPALVKQRKELSHPTFMRYNTRQDTLLDDYSCSILHPPLNESWNLCMLAVSVDR